MQPLGTVPRLGLVTVLAAATIVLGPASQGASFRVSAQGSAGDWSWDPSARVINRGDRIVWRNPTDVGHRVAAYSSNWSKDSAIASGESTAKRFRKAGLFKYRCTVGEGTSFAHSTLTDGNCNGMCGQVRVRR